ncbi:Hsp70 family protein [Kineosporia babensis]|uniref:Hsp70 family protein n=1 Tax=Kineosporia babensis TaxID=499548 RepID=A0A9X1NAP5_9ACTN|nr:Hsp70 family protein [Kineosporia babensis]MCD5310643.1 Hsp70 family protein [Kineosporia babensis]
MSINSGYGLGLDLGSVTLTAAVSDGVLTSTLRLSPDSPWLPAAVQSRPDGSLALATTVTNSVVPGHVFHRHLGDSTPFRLGNGSFTAAELLAVLLVEVLQRVHDEQKGPPTRVVLTCPAGWGAHRREQFLDVARQAGLPRSQVSVISQAEAVVADHQRRRSWTGAQPIAVYDAGGSTVEASVLIPHRQGRSQVIGVPEALDFQGGLDLDEALLAKLDETFGGALSLSDDDSLRQQCARAKEQLSSVTEVEFSYEGSRTQLNRKDLDGVLAPFVSAGLHALQRTLDSAGVRANDLAAVLLTGGSSPIPQLAEALTENLGSSVTLVPEPQHAAALGAAWLAARPEPHQEPRLLPGDAAG